MIRSGESRSGVRRRWCRGCLRGCATEELRHLLLEGADVVGVEVRLTLKSESEEVKRDEGVRRLSVVDVAVVVA